MYVYNDVIYKNNKKKIANFKHIHNYLLENNIIINNQSGFTKGDSAIYQLINITNEFGKALDEGKEVRVASFNILGLTASGPEALDMSKNVSISSTSFSVITICPRPCCLRLIFGVGILVSSRSD
jgi:hypothetical protein